MFVRSLIAAEMRKMEAVSYVVTALGMGESDAE